MPSSKSHEFFGISVWIFFLVFLLFFRLEPEKTIYSSLLGFVFCFTGSILPDIDQKKSIIFRHVRFLFSVIVFTTSFAFLSKKIEQTSIQNALFLILVCGLITIAAISFFYALLPRHRGSIHSIRTGIIFTSIALISAFILLCDLGLSLLIACFSFLAFASHLTLDRTVKW